MQVPKQLFVALLVCLIFAPTALIGASILDFPRLSNQPGSIVGVTIVNPQGADAAVEVTAYDGEGNILQISNVIVPGGERIGLLTSDLFGNLDPDIVGWFQAVSDSSGLTGFFLFLNSTPAELDGADLPGRDRDIVFNKVQVDDDVSTELNVVNPEGVATEVELTLVGGNNPVQKMVNLPARGAARLDVATFFGVAEVLPGAYVIGHAATDILGFEFIRRQGTDLQGLNARSAEEFLNTLYFAQMAVLSPFEAELGVLNYSNEAIIAVATAHKADGSLFVEEVQQNPVAIPLDPGQSVNRDLAELFGFQGDSVLEGWLEVTANTEAMNGQLTYRTTTGAAAAVAPVPQGSKAAIFAHVATTFGFFTGVAALNAAAFPATVELAVLSSDGNFVGGFTTVLNPGVRISELITDLVPQAENLAGGFIWIRSNVPLFLTSLFGSVSGDVLANVPPQDVSSNFDPVEGALQVKINPPLAVLPPTGVQGFALQGGGGAVEWAVNGLVGGNAQFGTISGAGVYTAPAVLGPDLPITVSGRLGSQAAGAGVDLVTQAQLVGDLGIVQSVAYLIGLDRLFSAELVALAAPQQQNPAGSIGSGVFDITPPVTREEVLNLDDTIEDMISFEARDGHEYLIFCTSESGTVQRLDPQTGESVVVASGLNSPRALAFDEFSENLLVAELDKISTIPRSTLEQGLPLGPASSESGPGQVLQIDLIPNQGVGGLAVDRCNGNIYFSVPGTGQVLAFNRSDGSISTLADGFDQPGQLLLLYRQGLTCPDASHLFVAEATQISLIIPGTGQIIRPWLVTGDEPVALTFVPASSSFADEDGLLVGSIDFDENSGQIVVVYLPDLYEGGPVNPPITKTNEGDSSAPGPDLTIAAATGQLTNNATVNVFFRPGPQGGAPGGPDEIAAAVFSIDFDESKLSFNPTDGNGDGIPDAIISSLPAPFEMDVFYDPSDTDGELDFVLVDLNGAASILPEGNLFSITFVSLADTKGTASVGFSAQPPASLADTQGQLQELDELISGKVSVFPQPSLADAETVDR